jgi:hypothetical protein
MPYDCLHTCHVCTGVYTHASRCSGVEEVPICRMCELEGYEAGWCPSCENTQPIAKGAYRCDECEAKPYLRTA